MRTHTRWIKSRIQSPERVGVYEVKTKRPVRKGAVETYEPFRVPDYAHPGFRYWDGTHWFLVRKVSFERCDEAKAFGYGIYQYWRGLTKREHNRMQAEFDR